MGCFSSIVHSTFPGKWQPSPLLTCSSKTKTPFLSSDFLEPNLCIVMWGQLQVKFISNYYIKIISKCVCLGKESLDHPAMPMKIWCSQVLMLFVPDKMEKASITSFSRKLFPRLFCFHLIPLIPRKFPNMQCWENAQGTHWTDTWKQSIVVVIIQ